MNKIRLKFPVYNKAHYNIYSFTATLPHKDFIIFITNFYYILIIQFISYFIKNKNNLCDVRLWRPPFSCQSNARKNFNFLSRLLL